MSEAAGLADVRVSVAGGPLLASEGETVDGLKLDSVHNRFSWQSGSCDVEDILSACASGTTLKIRSYPLRQVCLRP